MKLTELRLKGAFQVDPERHCDERGFFARAWCKAEFARNGIDLALVQASLSHTLKRGTVRGMHFQIPPSEEGKLIRCVRGAVFDVVVDIRPSSATYLEHVSLELSSANGIALYVPAGFAHGFQTLTDDVDVFYEMTDVFAPELARGFRWDDPAVPIEWPLKISVISDRDRKFADILPSLFEPFG